MCLLGAASNVISVAEGFGQGGGRASGSALCSPVRGPVVRSRLLSGASGRSWDIVSGVCIRCMHNIETGSGEKGRAEAAAAHMPIFIR